MAMWSARIEPAWDLAAWRDAARAGLRGQVPPEDIDWQGGAQDALLVSPRLAEAPAHGAAPRRRGCLRGNGPGR